MLPDMGSTHLVPRQVDTMALAGYPRVEGSISHAATDPVHTQPCVLDRSASRGPTWEVVGDAIGGTATIQTFLGGQWRDTTLTFAVTGGGVVDTYDCTRLLAQSRLKFVPSSATASTFLWAYNAQVVI